MVSALTVLVVVHLATLVMLVTHRVVSTTAMITAFATHKRVFASQTMLVFIVRTRRVAPTDATATVNANHKNAFANLASLETHVKTNNVPKTAVAMALVIPKLEPALAHLITTEKIAANVNVQMTAADVVFVMKLLVNVCAMKTFTASIVLLKTVQWTAVDMERASQTHKLKLRIVNATRVGPARDVTKKFALVCVVRALARASAQYLVACVRLSGPWLIAASAVAHTTAQASRMVFVTKAVESSSAIASWDGLERPAMRKCARIHATTVVCAETVHANAVTGGAAILVNSPFARAIALVVVFA